MLDEPQDDALLEEEVEIVHDDEILESQERLGKALDTARAGEDLSLIHI